MRICSVPLCGREVKTRRRMCEGHYTRLRRYGDVGSSAIVKVRPLAERFAEKVVATPGGCWRWIGALSPEGYGQIWVLQTRSIQFAHRVSHELHIGPIPNGLHVDHLCRNRWCVNPIHLEAVTQAENNRRAASYRGAAS